MPLDATAVGYRVLHVGARLYDPRTGDPLAVITQVKATITRAANKPEKIRYVVDAVEIGRADG